MKFAEYILSKSESRAYSWIVFLLTVCESIFLFIPPEVFMTPPIIANKKRAVPITVAAALGSIVGGAIAYMIGMWLWDSLGMWIINTFSNADLIDTAIKPMFDKYGILIIVLTAVTPIPYKLLALWLGFIGYPIWIFIGVSAIFRTGRFAIVAALLYFFQERANAIVKKYFWPLTIGAIIAAGLGIGLISLFT
ncbi:MAG: DedA family protein [Proteobacteria bacterium]|uniref:DedA family protein n=1 Tax=Candidatus Enterousia excrementavium TaxID=2840789 RepID=A0A940DH69_9PROT|nr:DedA family protein [Candidatus Enterousia excrementavium]